MTVNIPTTPKVADEPKKTHKRDVLCALEAKAQTQWEQSKVNEIDAPTIEEHPDSSTLHEIYPKFHGCMAYPYMNGRLHLGHAFTVSKIEFATGYYRLKGRRALFPQGFHCTGMPIKACADKLAREIEMFGQNFERYQEPNESAQEESISNEVANLDLNKKDSKKDDAKKSQANKGKVAAKASTVNYQFQIMLSQGVPREEIHKFANPYHWLKFFPPMAISDMRAMGLRVDWRRSFITTDANPYYDSFVRWQMNKLHALKKIKFGERYTIYSPLDQQPCMDHDRQTGEAVGPQEYVGIKLEVLEFGEKSQHLKEAVGNRKVYMVAATLRPETMYGQTNCFVGPQLQYGLFLIDEQTVFICTQRAARNMAFQGFSIENHKVTSIGSTLGEELVGTKVRAPLSPYEYVYVLPMENVLATKGTGVVTSVPSDSPDDYITMQDLAKKTAYYKIQPEWVTPFKPVPIVKTQLYGDLTAPHVCKLKKINSQKDKEQLAEAKEMAYKEGFYNGTMLVGDFAGEAVQVAKPKIRELLVKRGDAFIYNEPESLVMSRSGDECVVALLDQWYLDYGEEEWRGQTEKCLENINTYGEETRHQFQQVLAWLNQWACARSFGLGTRLPWDPQFLVESLSDSTIYMAYYTVAHILHGGNLDGSSSPYNIPPEAMTDAVWDHIFMGTPAPADTQIPKETLQKLQREFDYFYPLDLRVSGKDLIPNHLTFWLYNHVALFPESKWPLGVRANGHLMLNGEKMSKSTGNFMTMNDAIAKYGADATRISLADAGDGIEDANFEEVTANAAILRLFTLMEWCEDMVKNQDSLRTGPVDQIFHDRVFAHEMNRCIHLADEAYSQLQFREALKNGFYELQHARDWYQQVCQVAGGMHRDLVLRFIEVQALLLSPIAPHWAEHIWSTVLKKPESVMRARWPEAPKHIDEGLLEAASYIRSLVKQIRDLEASNDKKGGKKSKAPKVVYDPTAPKALSIYVASSFPEWQNEAMEILKLVYVDGKFDDAAMKKEFQERGLLKNKKVMPFAQEQKKKVEKFGAVAFNRALLFNELEVLNENAEFIKRTLGFHTARIIIADSVTDETEKRAAEIAVPGEPGILFKNEEQN
ncbi:uncharacterized protein VTP21DRAFT_4813 [Calcarisporiella thermophila]|uniref:uncharacterized protein n=1 Tax=Calcarisporiella thermophila TaxID=911321 RepID=UPI003744965E